MIREFFRPNFFQQGYSVSIKTPADLKEGQIIELRWEYFDHDQEEFEPRFLRVLLLERIQTSTSDGWKTKVIYDSNLANKRKTNSVPYDNFYWDTWVQMSINQNKLKVIS